MSKSKNKYFNPNPSKKETGDCVVRALCKATDKDWFTVYDELVALGRELHAMPNSDDVWKYYVENNPAFIEHTIRIKKGMKRPTPETFLRKQEHKKGRYLFNMANHLLTADEGYYHDIWESGDRAIYKYWEIDKTKLGVSE